MSIKFAVVNFLKADAGVSALVGSRVTPRRASVKSAYPLLIVHKISDAPIVSQSGNVLESSRLQIDVVAQTDESNEQVQSAVRTRLHLFQGSFGGYYFESSFLEDAGDSLEENFFEEDLLLSHMDFIIDWRII